MNEALLVERLRQQDHEALFILHNEYHDRVFAVVRRVVRDVWDAEEVTQDVFMTVHRKIHLFREDSSLWSWMYRIAVNAAKMRVRKYRRQPIPMEDELLFGISSDDACDDTRTRPDRKLMCQEMLSEVQAFLESSSEKNRALYLGMELDGATKEDVAEELDLTVPAVKTRLHRMRAGLREHLTARYELPA